MGMAALSFSSDVAAGGRGWRLDGFEDLIGKYWGYLVVLAPGALALWRQWREQNRADRKDRSDLVKIAQDAARGVIEDLREDNDRLRARLGEIEDELEQLRQEHSRAMMDKDAKITLLEGEKQQLKAQIGALERLLAHHHIELPKQGELYWSVPAGTAPPPTLEPGGGK